jgi:excisionase family DNA binding protein
MTLDDLIAERVEQVVRDAAERIIALVEESCAQQRTHYSVSQAAAAWGISNNKRYDLVESGDLPHVRLGTRIVIPTTVLRQLGSNDGAG